MRLSSIVSVVIVTASFALGGCAADAESADDSEDLSVARSATSIDKDSNGALTQVGHIGDQRANPSDVTKAELAGSYVNRDPRLEPFPSPFGQVPAGKIGAFGRQFDPLSNIERAAEAEEGYQPYSHPKP